MKLLLPAGGISRDGAPAKPDPPYHRIVTSNNVQWNGEQQPARRHLQHLPTPSFYDADATGPVEALVLSSDRMRALLIAEVDLGERLMWALILRHTKIYQTGIGGPVIIGHGVPLRGNRHGCKARSANMVCRPG